MSEANSTAGTPVPITAYACVSDCGVGTQALYTALSENRTALRPPGFLELPFTTVVGEVPEPLPELQPNLEKFATRNARMGLATLDAEGDDLRVAVEAARERYGPERIGVVLGTSTSGVYETEMAYAFLVREGAMPSDFNFMTRHAYQASARLLQLELAVQGPCYAISTACSSSGKALAAAQRLINSGVCDAVLAGGVDTLCRLTVRGFHSLELISAQPCRPMDRIRDGINIGEGCGLLLLEKPSPSFRDKPHLVGTGESSDAYHMSAPHPQGKGARLAMQYALDSASLNPDSIDYINLHGTASPLNDRVEAKVVHELFGESIPCSATKGITGHTLGAAGAIEAIISLLALTRGFIPGTCGLNDPDPQCRCGIVLEPREDQSITVVMSNVFGFGGSNVSLVFARL